MCSAELHALWIWCSPRWRTSSTRASPSGAPQWPQASGASAASSSSPGPHCGPWMCQGTTCSRRQKTARSAPGISAARQPSPSSTGSPHQLHCAVDSAPMAAPLRIIVLEGDETGQELLELDPSITKVDTELEHYDLSLDNRRKTGNEVVTAAAEAMAEARFGLKA